MARSIVHVKCWPAFDQVDEQLARGFLDVDVGLDHQIADPVEAELLRLDAQIVDCDGSRPSETRVL